MKPFLFRFWKVLGLARDNPGERSLRFIRPRRFKADIAWLLAFFSRQRGCLARTTQLQPSAPRSAVRISTDASPWGIGGVLYTANTPIAYFADEIQNLDLRRFNATRGASGHTTLWEGLAILMALRMWEHMVD